MDEQIQAILNDIQGQFPEWDQYEKKLYTPRAIHAIIPRGVYLGEDEMKVQGMYIRGTLDPIRFETDDEGQLKVNPKMLLRRSEEIGIAALKIDDTLAQIVSAPRGCLRALRGWDGSRRIELEFAPNYLRLYLNGNQIGGN